MKVTTARLLKLRESGHTIVVTAQPYADRAVTYAPRKKYDPKPWEHESFRFSAGELHAVAPMSADFTVNTARANADMSKIVFEGDPSPSVATATGVAVALSATMRRLRAEDNATSESKPVVRDVLATARKAGFVVTHYTGSGGTAQLNHPNGNGLLIQFENGVFVSSEGYGWGDAPWAGCRWDTDDVTTFNHRIAT